MHNSPSLPYREAIIQSTNINCFSEKGEEFQVRKDFRVQPKMPAAPWAFPQKEERLQGPPGGRALEPHPPEPTGPQQVEAGPLGRLSPGSHVKPRPSSAGSQPCARKREDTVSFLPDSLGPLTNRCLNSFLSKVRTVASATKQLGRRITVIYKWAFK